MIRRRRKNSFFLWDAGALCADAIGPISMPQGAPKGFGISGQF